MGDAVFLRADLLHHARPFAARQVRVKHRKDDVEPEQGLLLLFADGHD